MPAYAQFTVRSPLSTVGDPRSPVHSPRPTADGREAVTGSRARATRNTHHVSRFTLHAATPSPSCSFAFGLMCKPVVGHPALCAVAAGLLAAETTEACRIRNGACKAPGASSAFIIHNSSFIILWKSCPSFSWPPSRLPSRFLVQKQAGFVASRLPASMRIDNALVSYLR